METGMNGRLKREQRKHPSKTGSSKETSSAVVAVAVVRRPFNLPFPETGASVTGISSPTLDWTEAASRKCPKNPM
jgi:hypothetical protein